MAKNSIQEKDKKTARKHIIRTLYLYTFALIGLILMTVGSVQMVDMALKTFIFTKADEEQRIWYSEPTKPYPYEKYTDENTEEKLADILKTERLTIEEKNEIKAWLKEYKDWKERKSKIDPVIAQRQRDASNSLAMIIIGLPLYLYHWSVIKKESKKIEA
ncbi:hypothetical protein HYV57_00420 [Candidatus Peregrinibacteria bacterium]|nr:hypothetical protein [Candidatus Peregrinibacteria bacterium]